ncbi:MAG: phage tail tape measure protein [Syntrophomonas sp.]|nr:phage tail tape measure protein [Syntrophomonas sp.]
MGLIGSMAVAIIGDISGLDTSLKQAKRDLNNFNKDVDKIASGISNMGSKLTMGITAPIVGAGAAAFKMAADLQDAMGATDQIFKASADSMKAWADDLPTYYGVAEGEALEYANMMGSMLQNIGGMTEEQAGKQAQTLVALAGDLTAMYGGTTADAVRALTGSLKGNNTMLDNYGMAVNDAMIKTKAMEMGLLSEGESMDLATKQAATLALIMEQTGAAQGQASREAAGASGSMRALVTELKNIATSIGDVLLPVITPFLARINEMLQGFKAMSPATQELAVKIALIAAAVGPALMVLGPLISLVGGAISTFGAMGIAIKAGAAGMAVFSAGFPTLGAAIGLLTGPVGWVIGAIALLAAGAVLVYKNWDSIKTVFASVGDTIVSGFNSFVGFFTTTIPNTLSGLLGIITGVFDGVVEFINGIWDRITLGQTLFDFLADLPNRIGYDIGVVLGVIARFVMDAIAWFASLPQKIGEQVTTALAKVSEWGANLIKWATTEVPKFIQSVIDFYITLPGRIWEWLQAAYVKVGEWGVNLIAWAKREIPKVIKTIVDFFVTLPATLMDIGVNMIKGLWDGIISMGQWLKDKVASFVDGIKNGFEDGFEISSPSKVMEDIGKNISLGLAQGINSGLRTVETAVSGLVGGVTLNPALAAAGTNNNYGGATIYMTVNASNWSDIERELNRRGVRI